MNEHPYVEQSPGVFERAGARLEDLTPSARVRGVTASGAVTVVGAEWHGGNALTLTYREESGHVADTLLYRDAEARLRVERPSRAYAFDGDAKLFRLVAEALRIRMASRFDPMLAVSTSDLEPLPHQIKAVYGELLPRTPLRFLLADDPGAGKKIMAGLYIKELKLRGDLARCLIVAPGSLVEQWQEELLDKFGLRFELLTRTMIDGLLDESAFERYPLLIARMDQLSRSEELQQQLARTDYDVVVDEAHRMSAHYFGAELQTTKRYELGRLLGRVTRHLLLMTATPHAGNEADFQLFMALLDGDRFEGRYRDGVHSVDTDGLMRPMVKEDLLTFEGKPLFPERRADTLAYELSPAEQDLYEAVTDYVCEQMNRAEQLAREGEGRRGNTVGFALTVLQRRLASSPGAILRSLERRRRRRRLEARRVELQQPGGGSDLERRLAQLSARPSSSTRTPWTTSRARSARRPRTPSSTLPAPPALSPSSTRRSPSSATWSSSPPAYALASSIVLACRPREATAEATTRRGFLQALKDELPSALKEMQQGSLAPVDLAQAATGPGMAVFTRYRTVIEADGSSMTVRTALALINQVLDEVLSEQEGDFSSDTRFCVKWFSQFGWDEQPYGVAESLSKAVATSVDGLCRGGVFWARAGKARLVGLDELSDAWDPVSDERVSEWEVVVRVAKALDSAGVDEAARLMALAGQRVDLDTTKELAYLLYSVCEKKGWTSSAALFNGLGTSRSDLSAAGRSTTTTTGGQGELDYSDDEEA